MIPNYKSLILNVINESTCIKETRLALKIIDLVNPMLWSKEQYNCAIIELMETKEIVYIHYTTNEGTKILYFPKGTIFHFSQV